MTPKDRFFFDTQIQKAEVTRQLQHSMPNLRVKLKELPFNKFVEVCQACLSLPHYPTYNAFVETYTALDLEDFTKSARQTKEYYLESYRKTLTEALVIDATTEATVWFYFYNEGEQQC